LSVRISLDSAASSFARVAASSIESAPAVAAASNPITPKHKLLMIIDFPDRGLLRHVSPQQAGIL
jgi:hypothetical protein